MNTPTPIHWPPAVGSPRLGPGEVQLWCASLDDLADDPAALEALLSDDERERAQRLQSARDRLRFAAARALLREILAGYLALAPGELRFAYGPGGKPELAGPAAVTGLQFNLSHCEALALYAVSRRDPVGVDLERIRPLPEMTLIATRYFRPPESALLHRLQSDHRLETFFQLWTQKEALAKARGVGLAAALEPPAVPVGHRPPEPPWMTIRLHPAPGYAAALALSTPHPRLHCRRWVPRLHAGAARRLVECA